MARNLNETSMKRLRSLYIGKDEKAISSKALSNFDLMSDYIRRRKNEGLTHCTITCDIKALTEFSKIIDKPVRELTETEIYVFFDYLNTKSKGTVKIHKTMLNGFLKFAGREDLAKLCKIRRSKTDRRLPEDLLTPEDVEMLIDAANNLRDKAYIATLYETGAREGELEELQIKHVVFDEYGAVITLPRGKTGARVNTVVFSAGYLRNWLENHPLKGNREAWLWTSSWDHNKHVAYQTARMALRRAAEKAGIKKRVNPHSFRHARATILAKEFYEHELSEELGWTPGSNMPGVYIHISNKDRRKKILKMDGFDVIEPQEEAALKVIKCPRCKEMQDKRAQFCFKCGLPLTKEAVTTVGTLKTHYMQLADLDEIREMKNSLKKELEEITELKEMMLKHGK